MKLGIPGFGLDNWKSTNRKEVWIHEKYKDILPLFGSGVSDIAFEDANNHFVSLLILNGYPWVVSESGIGAGAKFYLNVNTTFEGCDTPLWGDKGHFHKVSQPSQPVNGTHTAHPPIARVSTK